jgi:hypothetical protein
VLHVTNIKIEQRKTRLKAATPDRQRRSRKL